MAKISATHNLKLKLKDLGLHKVDDNDEFDDVPVGPQTTTEIRTDSGDTLLEHQRLKLIEWIASGLSNKQINQRAAKYVDPFHVGSEILYYYRTYKQLDITAMKRLQEANAFNTGLAIRARRIEKLNAIAEIIYDHLVNEDGMWVDRTKLIGRGANASMIVEREFNDAEVKEFRLLMNDIALEVGQRVHKADVNVNHTVKGYTEVSPNDWDEPAVDATEVPQLEAGDTTPQAPVPVVRVDFQAVDPFAPDAPTGSTNFVRPQKSPKTTKAKTAKARAAAAKSNKVQAKRKKAAK